MPSVLSMSASICLDGRLRCSPADIGSGIDVETDADSFARRESHLSPSTVMGGFVSPASS